MLEQVAATLDHGFAFDAVALIIFAAMVATVRLWTRK